MPWQSLHAGSDPKIIPALFPDATSLVQIVIVAQSVAWGEFLKEKKDFVLYSKRSNKSNEEREARQCKSKKMLWLVQRNTGKLSANLVLGASSSVAVPLLYFGSEGTEQMVCRVILIIYANKMWASHMCC